MRDNLVEQIISDVMNKQTDISPEAKTAANFAGCGITEFVGTALGHTIGLVIANVDNQLHEVMNIDKNIALSVFLRTYWRRPANFTAGKRLKQPTAKLFLLGWAGPRYRRRWRTRLLNYFRCV